jgi:hypothetical protein
MEHKMDLYNIYGLEVNNFLGNSVSSLIDTAISSGNGIDLVENICDVDVLVGNFYLENIEIQNIVLRDYEPLLMKISQNLIEDGLASSDQVYDNESVIAFVSGSHGYHNAYKVVKNLKDFELNILIALISDGKLSKLCGLNNLTIGINLEEGNWKNSSTLSVKISKIVEAYSMYHKSEREMIDKSIIIIPSYYWIQEILDCS